MEGGLTSSGGGVLSGGVWVGWEVPALGWCPELHASRAGLLKRRATAPRSASEMSGVRLGWLGPELL